MIGPNQFLVLLSLASFTAAASPRVKDAGNKITYAGTSDNGVESFLNIPFAKNVDGEKRFTNPVAKSHAPGTIVDASRQGPACPQQKVPLPPFPFLSNVTNVSENCLNLRVDRAANTTNGDELLPVMVFIYGGGLSTGQAYDRVYNPMGLLLGAAEKRSPVIYVAMNYRLKIFGFAASDALSTEGNTNLGLRDQELALQWVQQNIKAFGGDPAKVTIVGESDGATSVGLQMTAYGGKRSPGLFHRAIMESGSPVADKGVTGNTSRVSTMAVAKALKCPLSPSTATLKCLRSAPSENLLNATLTYESAEFGPLGFGAFIPYIDGTFIPAAPSELIRQGKFVEDVPVLIGWNQDDASLFTDPSIQNETDVEQNIQSRYGLNDQTTTDVLAMYPASGFKQANDASASFYRASRIGRDLQFTCPSVFFAEAVAKNSPSIAPDVFLYQLDQTPLTKTFADEGAPFYGVSHFSDIFYVFNEVPAFEKELGTTSSDTVLAKRMSGSWTSFVAGSNPGSAKGNDANTTTARWTPIFSKKGLMNVFAIGGRAEGNVHINNKTSHSGLESLAERCAFLTSNRVFKQLKT